MQHTHMHTYVHTHTHTYIHSYIHTYKCVHTRMYVWGIKRFVMAEMKLSHYLLCILQIPVSSWFDDPSDTELRDLIPFFEALDKVDNVLTVLGQSPLPHTSIEEDDEDLT